MCLKKGNSESHRKRFSLLVWAISVIKNEEKCFISFNIQISFCTRGSLSTGKNSSSPGLKDFTESKRGVTGHCHLHCGAEVSGKVPSPMN